jgi:alkanesulfonate monooxygenase SsuD/methylene tetrahydromethanopterin reductase-like flavin-dependent oxidoreductase (luciferase family)
VRKADGWMPLLIPGLDPTDLRTAVVRLRQLCEDAGRDPATLPIHGRVYLGPAWQERVEEALELGFADLSIGVNRLAQPDLSHADHLAAVIDAKPVVDKLVG